jgi:hypothetical protein
MPVIGVLGAVAPKRLTERWRGFRQGLREAAYVEGDDFILRVSGTNVRMRGVSDIKVTVSVISK